MSCALRIIVVAFDVARDIDPDILRLYIGIGSWPPFRRCAPPFPIPTFVVQPLDPVVHGATDTISQFLSLFALLHSFLNSTIRNVF
jgi:hypothetical protein